MKKIGLLSPAITFVLTVNIAFADVVPPVPPIEIVVTADTTGNSDATAAIQSAIDTATASVSGGIVIVPSGTYAINAVTHLLLKSNVTLLLKGDAILKAMPNDQGSHSVIRIENASNVGVTSDPEDIGGRVALGTLIGERYIHTGTTGEWGMGIETFNAHNVLIRNLLIKEFWGDGLYIGEKSSNVTVDNVIADNNRRQGLTITSVDGATIKNSTFMNTAGTLPECGLDIEPNRGQTVNNVLIENSVFSHNNECGLQLSFGSKTIAKTAKISNVRINNNNVNCNGQIGNYSAGIKLSMQNGIIVTGNIVNSNHQDGISIADSSINNTINLNKSCFNGNESDRNSGYGIVFRSNSKSNKAINNNVFGNTYGIVDSVGRNTISPNTSSEGNCPLRLSC